MIESERERERERGGHLWTVNKDKLLIDREDAESRAKERYRQREVKRQRHRIAKKPETWSEKEREQRGVGSEQGNQCIKQQ